MKKVLIIIYLIQLPLLLLAQDKNDRESEIYNLNKTAKIEDRAGGTHNASNIGLFFENRGKLYPRRVTQGPSGEFPINSGKHYIYRVNQWVGVPGNVVQARFTEDEEWEAAAGYHNRDTARIAFSDDPNSWNPNLGWPVKTSEGENIFLSDQDSYCVFNDSNNTVSILGVQLAQTGYAFGTKFAKNILFFKYELTNISSKVLNDVYFGLYNDIDVGNVSGGDPEYLDDKIDFIKERNLLYFFDDGISNEWIDGKTGFFGVMMLKTPEINGVELGITDMHYNLYDDEVDIDTVQYGILSSSESLYNSSIGHRFFHPGNNGDIHFDDPSTIPASGLDLAAVMSSGPYTISPGDTLVFYTAFVAGENFDEMLSYSEIAQNAVAANFNLPKAPSRPKLSAFEGDFRATLFWNDESEKSFDDFSGYDFEGYRLYRSNDKGISWEQIADFDQVNAIGKNTGLQYSFVDSNVVNGFEYWYSITAYDKGTEAIESMESPIGNNLDAVNTVSVIPRSDALGRVNVLAEDIQNLNSGKSNYLLNVVPVDDDNLSNGNYKTSFNFVPRIESGDLATDVKILVTDSAATFPYKYAIKFTSETSFDVKNLTLDTDIRTGYNYPVGGRDLVITGHGIRISMIDNAETETKYLPEQGDIITINYAMNVVKNNSDSVINNRPYQLNQVQTTTNGISMKLTPPNLISNVSRIGGSDNIDIQFKVLYPDSVLNKNYVISVIGNGTLSNKKFVIINVSDTKIISDTLFNSDSFYFEGIEAKITFDESNLPSAENKFSLETIKAVQPNILDSYSFKIKGSSVSEEIIKNDINKIRVVPNPYVVASLYEPEFGELRKEPLRQIQFINLPNECTIYIFTVDADLIKTLYHDANNGTEVWDLRTEGGREIAAGMYMYVVKSKTTEFKERFAVIK
ncbi:MAG: hypothetical protein H6611_00790 [Ignavibacteriales bacterium]|nr:hypothetical protein [Ignavibacteriales bacterium]